MTPGTPADVESVKAAIVETLGLEDRAPSISADTLLFGSLPELDSMAVLELIVVLEDQFGIVVDGDDVSAETFESVASLTEFVRQAQATG
jgi:acyl carrier protein